MELPKHVAIIMDGNRRHARRNGLKSLANVHVAGYDTCREITRTCFRLGVVYVTVWAASHSNLKKRIDERPHLYRLLKQGLHDEKGESERAHFYLRGSWREFTADPELDRLVIDAEWETDKITERHFTVLFGHSGLYEIADAASRVVRLTGRNFSPDILRDHSYNRHLPDVDLIIRTGIEQNPDTGQLYLHNSDSFLPLHDENAVLYYTKTLWPDFSADELNGAFEYFAECPRRNGK
jgi:undecaprenyl diphosphate synthase